jgi:hypothetical protein
VLRTTDEGLPKSPGRPVLLKIRDRGDAGLKITDLPACLDYEAKNLNLKNLKSATL